MNPLLLSILVNDDKPTLNHVNVLQFLPTILRVRIVPKEDATVIWSWLDCLNGKRNSIDLTRDGINSLHAGFGTDSRINQVRITIDLQDIVQLHKFVTHIRGNGIRPPVVFLVNTKLLTEEPDLFSDIFNWQNVFVNPVLSIDNSSQSKETCDTDGSLLTNRFAKWRAYLGDRMFVSLPPIASHAKDEGAAPCPSKLGLHIVLDAQNNCVQVCDCSDYNTRIPLDDNGLWLTAWRKEVFGVQSLAVEACISCPLWNSCQGGCLAPRADGILRDRHCPWPQKSFLSEG